jgi:hypothetical protein
MKLKNTVKNIFSIFIIVALILNAQQAFAHEHECGIGGPVLKAVQGVLQDHDHDEVEVPKAFHKAFPTVKAILKCPLLSNFKMSSFLIKKGVLTPLQ